MRVIYIGPERVFHGLAGRLIEAADQATGQSRLYFQPESDAIMALACAPEQVRPADGAA